MDKDITNKVSFGRNDDECLPLTKCACGKEFRHWDFTIGMERDYPKSCPNCKREMFFTLKIKIYEKEE